VGRHANALVSHAEDGEHGLLGIFTVVADESEGLEHGALSINHFHVHQAVLFHAVVLYLLNHERRHELVNVNVNKEVPGVLGVPIDLCLQLSNLLLGSFGDVEGLKVFTFALLIVIGSTIIGCGDPEGLDSQTHVFIFEANLFHASMQLPHLASALDRAVLLPPGRGIRTCAPHMVLVPVTADAILISNNGVLVTKVVLDSGTALLVVHLGLEVLVAIEIKQVILLVSPLRIVVIILIDLVGPPRDHLSLLLAPLQPKDVNTWLFTSTTFGQRNPSWVPFTRSWQLGLATPGT